MRRGAILAVVVALAVALPAHGGRELSPESADDDVAAARAEHRYGFCKKPFEPMGLRAMPLCELADEVDDCEGFVKACERLRKPPDLPKVNLDFLRFLGVVGKVLLWLFVAAIVAVVLIPIIRALGKLRRDRALRDEVERPAAVIVPTDTPLELPEGDPDALLRSAEDHVKRGELDRALAAYLGAALRALDRRGAVRMARDRTNGEYVRGCTETPARAPLREIVREVDRTHFGKLPATREAVDRVALRATTIVRAAGTAIVAVALFLAGCGAPFKGADPAGDELFRDLLEKQAVRVSKDRGPLQSLKPPKPDTRTYALVVDQQRVSLDEDATKAVLHWVRGGGVLLVFEPEGDLAKELGVERSWAAGPIGVRRLGGDDEEPSVVAEAHVARSSSLRMREGEALATYRSGAAYAWVRKLGNGRVVAVANDDLLTNIGLARKGNAAALVAILVSVDRDELRLARQGEGTSPAADPLTSMVHAGLGPALAHALVAVLLLYLAVGVRLMRPTPTPPPPRRAFAEHVVATAAIWARARLASHALTAFARFVDARLRAKMPRGAADPAAFLAARSGKDRAHVADVYQRAMRGDGGARPGGDLALLKELSHLYAAAMRSDS